MAGKTLATLDEPPVERWTVRMTHPTLFGRIVFSSVSERRARNFIERRYPRGSEAHLVAPDGTIESYEHERSGPYGTDEPQWAEFDPASWNPPEYGSPPGETEWADREG